ncbi:hypothetical protein T4D_6631 [Trichinella pseudospiralis]|uniref:Uncharacterized protein n=1 Tax=Trichinella pseudospiralis TaxID=6337 RepID=A0A0V1G4S7_TRIPS|nr:hypothetical protein T4D_6631 [Trichinella pseudospiralis]
MSSWYNCTLTGNAKNTLRVLLYGISEARTFIIFCKVTKEYSFTRVKPINQKYLLFRQSKILQKARVSLTSHNCIIPDSRIMRAQNSSPIG